MARKTARGGAKRARRKTRPWRRAALAAAVALAGLAAWFWWNMRDWAPSEDEYPEQGVAIGALGEPVRFDTVRALGGRFVYLEASRGAEGINPRFAQDRARAQAAGLKVGAIHVFDPCERADGQSANFVTVVPHDPDLLPPAIALLDTADQCRFPVSEAAVQSELMTLINQIERHAAKPAILKLSRAFEERYRIAGKIERDLWVLANRFEPGYAGRPWLLWSANLARRTEAAGEPIEWVVVQN